MDMDAELNEAYLACLSTSNFYYVKHEFLLFRPVGETKISRMLMGIYISEQDMRQNRHSLVNNSTLAHST